MVEKEVHFCWMFDPDQCSCLDLVDDISGLTIDGWFTMRVYLLPFQLNIKGKFSLKTKVNGKLWVLIEKWGPWLHDDNLAGFM